MPPDPLEGARAGPRRDRVAITSFGVLDFHAPPPPPPRDSNPGSATGMLGKERILVSGTDTKWIKSKDCVSQYCRHLSCVPVLRAPIVCPSTAGTGYHQIGGPVCRLRPSRSPSWTTGWQRSCPPPPSPIDEESKFLAQIVCKDTKEHLAINSCCLLISNKNQKLTHVGQLPTWPFLVNLSCCMLKEKITCNFGRP